MAKTKAEQREKKPRRMSGAALQAVLSAVALLLGALLTFVPDVSVRTLCYAFCALLIAAGVAAIVYFFMTGAYKRLDDYNFALGVLLLILGCCGFAQIGALELSFRTWMGFLTLVIGVIMLQNTVQMRSVDSGLWICALIFTALVIFGGIVIVADITAVWNALGFWIPTVAGALGIVTLILTAIALRGAAKRAEKAAEEPAAPAETEPAAQETAAAAEPAAPATGTPAETPPQDEFASLWPDDPAPPSSET